MELYGARMSVLWSFGRRIGRDEHPRRKHPDVRKLKSGPRLARHCLQGAHSEAPQEAPTVIGLPGPRHAVPVVGETPATGAYHQVTNVVREAHLWLRQRAESAQIGLCGRHLRPPHREASLAKKQSRRPPACFVPWIFDGHAKSVWQAIVPVKHANE